MIAISTTCRLNLDRIPTAIPEWVGHESLQLVQQLGQLTSTSDDDCVDITLTVRLRPVDRLGRLGCWVEIYTLHPLPKDTLDRIACRILMNKKSRHRAIDPEGDTRKPTSLRVLGLSPGLSGGLKLTLDSRWHP